jgi:hypothetical protein
MSRPLDFLSTRSKTSSITDINEKCTYAIGHIYRDLDYLLIICNGENVPTMVPIDLRNRFQYAVF